MGCASSTNELITETNVKIKIEGTVVNLHLPFTFFNKSLLVNEVAKNDVAEEDYHFTKRNIIRVKSSSMDQLSVPGSPTNGNYTYSVNYRQKPLPVLCDYYVAPVEEVEAMCWLKKHLFELNSFHCIFLLCTTIAYEILCYKKHLAFTEHCKLLPKHCINFIIRKHIRKIAFITVVCFH